MKRRLLSIASALALVGSLLGFTATPVFAYNNSCQTSGVYNDWSQVTSARPVGYVTTGAQAVWGGDIYLWRCINGPLDLFDGPSFWSALTAPGGSNNIAQIGVIRCQDLVGRSNYWGYSNNACHGDQAHIFWSVGSDCYSGGTVVPVAVDLGVAPSGNHRYEVLWDLDYGVIDFKIDGSIYHTESANYAFCWLNSGSFPTWSTERWDQNDLAGVPSFPMTTTSEKAGFYTHGWNTPQLPSCDTTNAEQHCLINSSTSATFWSTIN